MVLVVLLSEDHVDHHVLHLVSRQELEPLRVLHQIPDQRFVHLKNI